MINCCRKRVINSNDNANLFSSLILLFIFWLNLHSYFQYFIIIATWYCCMTSIFNYSGCLAFQVQTTHSSSTSLPPENDLETNRILEQFIWDKIIGAPTDPVKAYEELRSSLKTLALLNSKENINLKQSSQTTKSHELSVPEYIIRSLLLPRALIRRSSLQQQLQQAQQSKQSQTDLLSSGSTTYENQSQNNSLVNAEPILNRYIPEYGSAKDLYTIMASTAGMADKSPPIQLPPPPLPSQLSSPKTEHASSSATIDNEENSQTATLSSMLEHEHLRQQQNQQELVKETLKKIPKSNPNFSFNLKKTTHNTGNGATLINYNSPLNNSKHFLTTAHFMRHFFKKDSLPTTTSSSNSVAEELSSLKPELPTSSSQQPKPEKEKDYGQTSLNNENNVNNNARQHQQAQSQSIYDIMPMPSYGIQQQHDHYHTTHHEMKPFQMTNHFRNHQSFSQPFGNNIQQTFGEFNDQTYQRQSNAVPYMNHSRPYIPPTYEAKRTFEVMPIIEQQRHDKEYQEQYTGQIDQSPPETQIIDVIPEEQPIEIVFRSSSARVSVKQIHMPVSHQEVETTRTEEKPQRVLHQLVRPIVQEVVEIIQPYRRVTQEIRPVLEEIRTVVAKPAAGSKHRAGRLEQINDKKW